MVELDESSPGARELQQELDLFSQLMFVLWINWMRGRKLEQEFDLSL